MYVSCQYVSNDWYLCAKSRLSQAVVSLPPSVSPKGLRAARWVWGRKSSARRRNLSPAKAISRRWWTALPEQPSHSGTWGGWWVVRRIGVGYSKKDGVGCSVEDVAVCNEDIMVCVEKDCVTWNEKDFVVCEEKDIIVCTFLQVMSTVFVLQYLISIILRNKATKDWSMTLSLAFYSFPQGGLLVYITWQERPP